MWIWIIIALFVLYWIFELIGNSIMGKFAVVAIVGACAFWVMQLITGWPFLGLLVKFCLVAAVLIVFVQFVVALFNK